MTDCTITTKETARLARDKAKSALVSVFLSAALLLAPVLFAVFFLVPYLRGG